MLRLFVTVACFQAAWLACALGASSGWPVIGIAACGLAVAVAVGFDDDRFSLVALVVALGSYGFVVESAALAGGFVVFSAPGAVSGLAPSWIVALWMAFATLIAPAFGLLRGRPVLTGLLGGAMGPVAYLAAERLGALAFGEPRWLGLAAIGAIWALALPAAIALNATLRR